MAKMPGTLCWNLPRLHGGHLFLILVIGTSTFHSANGIRLLFTETGRGLGKPGRPDYPYSPVSLNYRQKSGIWIVSDSGSDCDVIWSEYFVCRRIG